jgi:hypothetical protein
MVAAFGAQIEGWSHWLTIGAAYGIGILLMLIATVLITKSHFSIRSEKQLMISEQNQGVVPGIPTLSSLLGQSPNITFDAKKFFAQAYYSPITAEFEKNMKIIAQQQFPDDKEGFYARFIGVGLAAVHYEQTWVLIFGSQLKAMEEMNFRGLITITDLKKHYDKAVIEYPNTYVNYSFDQWYAFIKSRMLIADYPSKMVELSWMGKDFWRWIAHTAREISKQNN